MDWGSTIANIVLSLSVTVFGYLLVPIILILKGNKYDAKKLKRINRINCIIVWILFRIIRTAINGEPGTGVAVFLWGAVGQHLLNKYCLEETTKDCADSITSSNLSLSVEGEKPLSPNFNALPVANRYVVSKSELPQINETPQNTPHKVKPTQVQPNQPPAPSQKRVKYCSLCGKPINPNTKKCTGCGKQYFKGFTFKAFLITMLCILFVVSFAGNIILCLSNVSLREEYDEIKATSSSRIAELKTEILDLTQAKENLQSKINANAEKIDFLDNHIVVVEDDGTNLYHKYDCYKFLGNSFWAFNTKAAESKGYEPCPLCCD